MKNLKQETLKIMAEYGMGIDDIAFVCGNDYAISTELFWELTDKEYDNGYGVQEVAIDLKVVFNDGSWLERYEYDGSEWWEYKKTPIFKKMSLSYAKHPIQSLFGCWDTLDEIRQEP